jgi:methionyl aminopeptidase
VIPIKTENQIKMMKEGGKRLSWVMEKILKEVKTGVALFQLDKLAEDLIKKQGGKPSFKMVPKYHWATCININEGVVHGIPDTYQLKENDLMKIDIGMFYRGLHTDMARTILVQTTNNREQGGEKKRFLRVGEKALRKAIRVAKAGNRVGHISQAIEEEVRKAGFSPIEVFSGHGVGEKLHEEPQIPCLLVEKIERTPLLKKGVVLAVEVIYAQGKPEVVLGHDGWTVKTADGRLAGLFEDTIIIQTKKPLVLTALD